MPKKLTPAERLIVAADFDPLGPFGERDSVEFQVLRFADCVAGTGVCLKVNSALRACGYRLIDELHARELSVFADLKLFDIGATLAKDGRLLSEAKPEFVTAVSIMDGGSLQQLKRALPDSEILGVGALTHFTDSDTQTLFGCSVEEAVLRFSQVAVMAGFDGLISSPKEIAALRAKFADTITLNTPNIRPRWAFVAGDDQNPARSMTPAEAIITGADRIIVGRPITQAEDCLVAVNRTLEEIASAL